MKQRDFTSAMAKEALLKDKDKLRKDISQRNTKVYLVTDGNYSDYRIIAAFLDKEEAYRFSNLYGYDYVEDFDTLDHDMDKGIMYRVFYRNWQKGDEYVVENCVFPEECDRNVFQKKKLSSISSNTILYILCFRAKDRNSALKIAHERMGAILAMGDALEDGSYTFPDYKKYSGTII